MKKVLSIIAIAAVSATFVACGPSQAELDAAAKKTEDSIRAEQDSAKARADRDTLAAQQARQAERDTLAAREARELAAAEAEKNSGKKGEKKGEK